MKWLAFFLRFCGGHPTIIGSTPFSDRSPIELKGGSDSAKENSKRRVSRSGLTEWRCAW